MGCAVPQARTDTAATVCLMASFCCSAAPLPTCVSNQKQTERSEDTGNVYETLIAPASRACRRPEASRTTPSLVSQWGPVCCGGSRQCLEAEAVGARVLYIYRQGCLQLGLLTRQSWEWIIRNACTQQAEAGQQLAAALTTPPGLDRVDT